MVNVNVGVYDSTRIMSGDLGVLGYGEWGWDRLVTYLVSRHTYPFVHMGGS